MSKKRFKASDVSAFTVLITAVIGMAFITAVAPAYAVDGLVIRGGECSAEAFKNGSGVTVDGDYITGLSANCTTETNNKSKYANYLQGIGGYGQYCVATMKSIGLVGGKITLDPQTGNPLHCLVSGKAKELAKKLTKYP